MQLVNKCCSQLPALLLEYCNLGGWENLLLPNGQLNSSSIKQDAFTVQYIGQQVRPAWAASSRTVLAAIMFMADIDILHRDIKPDNILFQGWSLGCCAVGAPPAAAFPSKQQAYPFVVKVGDFGCGCYKLAGMRVTRCSGTATFQPPEMSCPEATFHILW